MGALLFNGNCITCHHQTKTISAPSVKTIQENYLRAFPEKKEFVEHMSKWVLHPDQTTSIMLDAVEEYGLMPELSYELSTLEEIAQYLYDTSFNTKTIN